MLDIYDIYIYIYIYESSCGRGGDGPVAFNAQRQSLGFLFWMVTCSFTLYLLISHGMKAGGSFYSFIHSFIKGKCSRRLSKAPEMNIKHRHKQSILTYSHDNEISCDIVVHMYILVMFRNAIRSSGTNYYKEHN